VRLFDGRKTAAIAAHALQQHGQHVGHMARSWVGDARCGLKVLPCGFSSELSRQGGGILAFGVAAQSCSANLRGRRDADMPIKDARLELSK
jgi:hypothetical protein